MNPQSRKQPNMQTGNSKLSLRVLIAEDNPAIQEELKALLTDTGHQVVAQAYTGPAAVTLAEQHKPDAVLLDLVMPDPESGREDREAGIRATEAILRKSPAAIIWLTAYENAELMAQARRLGVSAYLVKPPRSNEIARAMLIAHARFADIEELRRLNWALASEIAERKRVEGELQRRNQELGLMNEFMVDRELRMVEMKKEVDGETRVYEVAIASV